MEEPQGNIYLVTNDINDKVYVGQTRTGIRKRWQAHLWDCFHKKNNNNHFYRALKKYGAEHFKIEIIEQCPVNQLNDREQYWIHYYDSYHNGYNSSVGGEGGGIKYDYKEIYDLWKSGLTIENVCKELNCGRATVKAALNSFNISRQEIKKHSIVYRENEEESEKNMIYMLSLTDNTIINSFINVPEAVNYLIEQNIISSEQCSTTRRNIYFCLNNKRRSAVRYRWCYKSNYSEDMEFKKPICVNKIPEETFPKIIVLWNEGKTVKSIASELNICEDTVSNYLHKNNIFTTEIKERASKLNRSSYPVSAYNKITKELIGSYNSIHDALVDLNIANDNGNHIPETIRGKRKSAYGYFWTTP